MGANAHARQIEPVGVPAGHDGRLPGRVSIAMQAHRFAEILELMASEFVNRAIMAQPDREVGRPVAVLWIVTIVAGFG